MMLMHDCFSSQVSHLRQLSKIFVNTWFAADCHRVCVSIDWRDISVSPRITPSNARRSLRQTTEIPFFTSNSTRLIADNGHDSSSFVRWCSSPTSMVNAIPPASNHERLCYRYLSFTINFWNTTQLDDRPQSKEPIAIVAFIWTL